MKKHFLCSWDYYMVVQLIIQLVQPLGKFSQTTFSLLKIAYLIHFKLTPHYLSKLSHFYLGHHFSLQNCMRWRETQNPNGLLSSSQFSCVLELSQRSVIFKSQRPLKFPNKDVPCCHSHGCMFWLLRSRQGMVTRYNIKEYFDVHEWIFEQGQYLSYTRAFQYSATTALS